MDGTDGAKGARMPRPMLALLALALALAAAGCSSPSSIDDLPDVPPPDAVATDDTAGPDADATGSDGGGDAPSDGGGPPLVVYTEDREPCADRNPLRNVYWGDLHVHTAFSFDAYTFDVRNDPHDAYRFARGETLMLPPLDDSGEGTRPVRISEPLDFAAVTDHSEYLGETQECTTPGSDGYDTMACQTYRTGLVGFALMGTALIAEDPMRPTAFCGDEPDGSCTDATMGAWNETREAAEEVYDRTDSCRFTSFVAYEHTGTPGGVMVHRNVIFRNDVVPELPISYFEAPRAHELWALLRSSCVDAGTGCDVLTIPHNSNYAQGLQFTTEYGGATSIEDQASFARERQRFEPLMEIYQHKGASECFPGFSTDEHCAFEILPNEPCVAPGEPAGCTVPLDFLRGALATGISEEVRIGVDPFRFGLIGSTDNHNATPGHVAEDDFPGHVGVNDDTERDRINNFSTFSPGGLAAVWAVENSRDAIFEAMARRETYASSGPRMAVRMFGGWGYDTALCADPDLVATGYGEGVPMGGVLPARGAASAPRFVVSAVRHEIDLQQIEIIKIWVDAEGTSHERTYVVAGDPDNGASVDTATCTPTGTGSASLCGVWEDPDFDPALPAVYYARVLENPTCRWSAHDCNTFPRALRPRACDDGSVPETTQERAWTSPIWYAP